MIDSDFDKLAVVCGFGLAFRSRQRSDDCSGAGKETPGFSGAGCPFQSSSHFTFFFLKIDFPMVIVLVEMLSASHMFFLLIFRYYTSIVHFNLNFKPFSFHDVSYTFFFTLLRLFIVLSQIFSSSSSTSTTMIRRHFLWIYLGHLKDGCRGRASCHPHGIMKFTTNYSV